jgi:hypothetical protein
MRKGYWFLIMDRVCMLSVLCVRKCWIITNGWLVRWCTGTSKVGFAGEDEPRSVFPTVVGRARHVVTTHL